ncbi:hypothetical protein M0P98_03635 [bacterium]|nr:hypothetical protein [bacterium]
MKTVGVNTKQKREIRIISIDFIEVKPGKRKRKLIRNKISPIRIPSSKPCIPTSRYLLGYVFVFLNILTLQKKWRKRVKREKIIKTMNVLGVTYLMKKNKEEKTDETMTASIKDRYKYLSIKTPPYVYILHHKNI